MDDIGKLKVVDLKKELQTRNLSTAGLKAELVQRLQEAIDTEGPRQEQKEEEEEEQVDVEATNVAEAPLSQDAASDRQGADPEAVNESRPSAQNVEAADSPPSKEADEPARNHADDQMQDRPVEPNLLDRIGRTEHVEPTKEADTEIELGNEAEEAGEEANVPSKDDLATLSEAIPVPRPHDSAEDLDSQDETCVSVHTDPPIPLTLAESKQTTALDSPDGEALLRESEPSSSLYIAGLIRPLTFPTLRARLQEFGDLGSDGISEDRAVWLDGIKTHAYVTYKSIASAQRAQQEMSGSTFPAETGRVVKLVHLPTEIVSRCVKYEEEAWEKDRSRVELRVRPAKDVDGNPLFSLHVIKAEQPPAPRPKPQNSGPNPAKTSQYDGDPRRSRGQRGGRGRDRVNLPPRTPDADHGYAPIPGHDSRRDAFERQSASRRRDVRDEAFAPRNGHARHGDSADERLRKLEARLLAQRRERETGGLERGGGVGSNSNRNGGPRGGNAHRAPRQDWPSSEAGSDRYWR